MENNNLGSPVDRSQYFNKPSLVLRIKSILIDTMELIGLTYLTIHSDKYGQAIHDKIGNSIMTLEN